MAYPEISHLQTYRAAKAEHKYCPGWQTTLRLNFKSWARYTHPYRLRTGYKVGHPLRFTPSLAHKDRARTAQGPRKDRAR